MSLDLRSSTASASKHERRLSVCLMMRFVAHVYFLPSLSRPPLPLLASVNGLTGFSILKLKVVRRSIVLVCLSFLHDFLCFA